MQIQRSAAERDRAMTDFEGRLMAAVESATRLDYDAPGEAALAQARALLALLVESDFETELVAFGIAADGAIAISTANGVRTATVEIEPDGAVISVVVTDEATREVARVVTQPSLAEVARELERAA